MKRIVSAILCGLFAATTLPAFTPEWNDSVILEKDSRQGAYWLKSGDRKKFYGGIMGKRHVDAGKVKVWIGNGRIHVDLRNAFLKETGFIDIGFRIPLDKVDRTRPACFSMEIGGTAGLSGHIGLNGVYKDGKHYWNNKPFLVAGDGALQYYKKLIPETVRRVDLIARMRKPGIYTFGKAEYAPEKEIPVDPDRNLIVNGGAERGWYSSGVRNMINCTAGMEYSPFWGSNTYRYPLIAETDTAEKLSGNASFKFTVRHDKEKIDSDSHYIMHFNQVPVVMGKPGVLTLWMKADKPGRKVLIRLHHAPGMGFYGLNATVGTEWKKYQLRIPKMGGPAEKGYGWQSGKFSNFLYQLLTPRIEFRTPGTYWIDNASFFIADKGEYKEESLAVSGTLNKDSTYYFPGEAITTTLTITSANPAKRSVKLHWNLYDFFGKKVKTSPETVIPLKNGKAETAVVLTPPANLRGAMHWELVTDGVKHGYYLGIIDKSGTANPRLGVNLSQHNTELGIRYLKDFRYSSVRIWEFNGMIPGESLIEPYHKNGFYVLFCLSRAVPEHTKRHLFPKDPEPWKRKLRRLATRYKGMVDAWEIINEPNARAGMAKNPDPERYEHITPESNARIIRTVVETMRPIDPSAKFAGPTTCHTDLAWTSSVLAQGAWKYLDIITEHPYLTLPELPDYAQTLASMRKDAESYGKRFPVFATERGTMVPANPADNKFDSRCRKAAANLLRTMILCYAGGGEKFFDFSFNTGNYAITYNMVFSGNPDNNYLPKPGYTMYAAKALADRIENAPMVKQVRLGLVFRCYIFDHGHKRTAVLWKWSGAPEKITFRRRFDIYDFMGTRNQADSVVLSEYPCYVESELSTDELAGEIANAELRGDSDPVRATLNIKNSREFAFDIRNLTGKTLPAGTVRIFSAGVTKQQSAPVPPVTPEGKTEVSFETVRPIGLTPVPLKAEINGKPFTFQLKGITATYRKTAPSIDGDLHDWNGIPAITLTAKDNSFRYCKWSPEDEKAKAELRFAWNTDGFYMAVTVYKNGFHPVDENGTGGTWRGDGLQIGMDTLKNAQPGANGYQDDDFEYAAAMYKGRPIVDRALGSLALHDSLSKKLGVVDDVRSAIRVGPGSVTYELAFLPFAVSPFRLKAGESMRISVIANLNDGKKRIGYLQLTPGLGSAKKEPAQFIDIFLAQ